VACFVAAEPAVRRATAGSVALFSGQRWSWGGIGRVAGGFRPPFRLRWVACHVRAAVPDEQRCSAVSEFVFFRGILQRERGIAITSALYGLAGVVFFLPIAGRFFLVLLAVGVGMGLLGLVYGYVYERYGLAAGMACHAVVNIALFFIPRMVGQWWMG